MCTCLCKHGIIIQGHRPVFLRLENSRQIIGQTAMFAFCNSSEHEDVKHREPNMQALNVWNSKGEY